MGVQTFKIIRQKLGYSRYRMAKELGISQTQYTYLETKAKTAQTHILIKLQKLSKLSGEEFWSIFKKEAD